MSLMTEEEAAVEAGRIIAALRQWLEPSARAVLGLSGGLDSDLVARLLVRAIGRERVKVFTVIQDDMEERHLKLARQTAGELGLDLAEFDLRGLPQTFVSALAAGDAGEDFLPDGLLDPARAKCSLRTPILSAYEDRGYWLVGTSNRTEIETGFFLPLGDALWHFGPLAHLYKSEVRAIASLVGTPAAVLEQPASAGFWAGQEDLEDLAYWLVNLGPIHREREFSDEEVAEVTEIRNMLTVEKLDAALLEISRGKDEDKAAAESGLPPALVRRLGRLVAAAAATRSRRLGLRLPDLS